MTHHETYASPEDDAMTKPKQSCPQLVCEEVTALRWRVMLLVCCLAFGGYFIADFPGAIGTGPSDTIESRFIDRNETYTQTMNLGLYSAYSWPSTLTIMSGLLIDKYLGLRKATMFFSFLTLSGSLLFWLGVVVANYIPMVLGRILIGFGAESLTVCQSTYTARWFRGRRGLSLALSLSVAFLRLPTALNFEFSPKISVAHGVTTNCFIGVIACAASTCVAAFLVFIDRRAERKGQVHEESVAHAAPLSLKMCTDFPLLAWIVSLLTMLVYASMFPFVSFAENFFERRYGIPHADAGEPVSLYQICSAVGLLVSGTLVDILGRHSMWLIASLAIMVTVHLLFLATALPPALMMIMFAVSYCSMVSTIWTTIPYICDENITGLAYGVMTAFLNLGLAVVPLITGQILDAHTPTVPVGSSLSGSTAGSTEGLLPTVEGYRYAIMVLLAFGVFGAVASILLFLCDKRQTGVLGASPAERLRMKETLSDVSEPFFDNDDNTTGGPAAASGGNHLQQPYEDTELQTVEIMDEQETDRLKGSSKAEM